MAILKFSNKGRKDIYLTKNYNSGSSWIVNKDNIRFNTSTNDFNNYILASTCGSLVNDKIKIKTLPDKGRLFYVTNPTDVIPVYSDVTVGQEITANDLINYNVLRFNAEGYVDNQNVTDYATAFTFERYCSTTASNIITHVNLNMLHIAFEGGDPVPSDPENLEFFMRSAGITQSTNPLYNYCSLFLATGCYINRYNRTGFDIQSGDRVYIDNTGNTPYAGASKVFRIQSAIVQTDTEAYIGRIDNNGVISLLSICPAI